MKLTTELFDFGKNEALSLIISARRYSGKTFLIKEILDSDEVKEKFNQIIVFTDAGKLDNTWKDLKNKKVYVFDEYFEQDLIDLIESFKKEYISTGKKPKVLIVIDDLIEVYSAKKSSPINKLASRGRHFGISFIFTTQKYNAMPPMLRNNSTSIIFFKVNNGREMKTIEEDVSSRKFDITDVLDDVTTDPYNYLYIKMGEGMKLFEGNGLKIGELDL